MIALAVPNLNGNEKKYLNNCIDTTFVSSVGEYVNRFENAVAKVVGSDFAVATSAGTTGLHAALTAVGVAHGDLVILPSFTFIASANAIRHCGADPWLMDINGSTWCLDPEKVRTALEEQCEVRAGIIVHKNTGRRVAAMMPVYTLGNIPDMEAFHSLADQYHLPLVVDAACAIGAEYESNGFGKLADLSVLSFNGNKTITCGGGGAVVGNDEKLMNLVRHLTTTARVWPDYDFDMVGFNYRMTNIQAAVGCAQMERIDEFVKRKREIRAYYGRSLSSLLEQGISFFPTTDGSSCWFSGIVLPDGQGLGDVKDLCSKLKEREIEARPFWKPVHLQEPYKNSPVEDTKTTDSLWQRIVTLPCSTNITDEELWTVADTVKFFLRKRKFANEDYEVLANDIISDTFYSNNSFRDKISKERQYAELIVRKVLDIDPDSKVTLGNHVIVKKISDLPEHEFFESAIRGVKIDGDKDTHTQNRKAVTKEDFIRTTDSLFDMLAYFFIRYFEEYKFGKRNEVMRSFSLLPPIIRYKVLCFLYYKQPDNADVIDKLVLVQMKALNVETAAEWVNQNRDSLMAIPAVSDSVYQQMLSLGENFAKEFLACSPQNMYEVCLQKIQCTGDQINRNGVLYRTFEEAYPYYREIGGINVESDEIRSFNDIMDFLFLGRKVNV